MLTHIGMYVGTSHRRRQLAWDKDFQVSAMIGEDLIHQSARVSKYCLQFAESGFSGTVKITV